MSAWIIYNKDGLAKCEARKLEYSGEFLGACSVNVSISSPSPIGFELGDWLEYRGERFELNYDPSVVKEASSGAYGEGFVYENVVFNSLSDELTRCDFLDVVPSDNHIHYTSLPNFSFFAENVEALAERLQANLDRVYKGNKSWTVSVHPEFAGKTDINVVISNQTCWDALALAKSEFEANFIIKGRHITIGTSGIAVGNLFSYGRGNGLFKIEKNAESNQKIVTRLRAYGSTRNLPTHYYQNLEGGNVPSNMAVKHLMLPSFPMETLDPYIDSKNIETLGVRESTVFFDGTNGLEEIYPTMEGMTAEDLKKAGVSVNATGALDVIVSAEQLTDNGIIPEGGELKGNFKVTLKDIGFDINEHLSASGSATLAMKSGMCSGREFEIEACAKTTDGYELTCKRTEDTGLGLVFPYKDFPIKANDKFVLLNIEMPDVYIKAASQRLLTAAKAYLAKNDYVRYSYTPTLDNIFLARQHDEALTSGGVSIHDTIKEGDFIMFEDEDLGISGSVTIDSLSIKEDYSESIIPEYSLTLRNEKSVGTIEKIQNQVTSILNGVSGGSVNTEQVKSIVEAVGSTRFLSKTKDDRSKGTIASDKGFEVGVFSDGALGSGGAMYVDGNGASHGVVDFLRVRRKATFTELTIQELKSVGGEIILSPASMVCSGVESTALGWKCYFETQDADGQKVTNDFAIGDLARCQTFNLEVNRYYWRLVTGVGENFIILSKADCDTNSDEPMVGDNIVQLGSRTDKDRQHAIILSAYGEDAPSYTQYSGINNYSLVGKEVTKLSPNGNVLRGDFLSTSGTNISSELDRLQVDLNKVSQQVDTEFTMWFFDYDPTLDNYPSSEWVTENMLLNHVEDLFYNTATGKAYRFVNEDGYKWKIVTDMETIKALEDAAIANKYATEANVRLNNIVSDKMLSSAEKKEVLKEWQSVEAEYVHNVNTALSFGLTINDQNGEYYKYWSAHWHLGYYLNGNASLEDGDTPAWLADLETDQPIDGATYRKKWTDYYDARSALVNKFAELSEEKAQGAKDVVDAISSDDVLSVVEKKEVLREWETITSTYASHTDNAGTYGVSVSELKAAYEALGTYLNAGIPWSVGGGVPLWLGTLKGSNTPIDGATYRAIWIAYYDAETAFLNDVSDAINTKANQAASGGIKNFVNRIPTAPYNVGDLWYCDSYDDGTFKFVGQILTCAVARREDESFNVTDWKLPEYGTKADIKKLDDEIQLLVETQTEQGTRMTSLELKQDQITSIVNTTSKEANDAYNIASNCGKLGNADYYQEEDPSLSWSSAAYDLYRGATWVKPSDKTKLYRWNGSSWTLDPTADKSASTTTFVLQNKDKWVAIAVNFDENGNPTGASGFVTESNFAQIFSKDKDVQASMSAYVTKNADGELESGVKITADNVNINGFVNVGGNKMTIGGFSIESDKLTVSTPLEGDAFVSGSYTTMLDGSGIDVNIGDGLITSRIGLDYFTDVDTQYFTMVNVDNNQPTGGRRIDRVCALRANLLDDDYGLLINGGATHILSSGITRLNGLTLNTRVVTSNYAPEENDDILVVNAEGAVTITLSSTIPVGKVYFIKAKTGFGLTLSGYLRASSGSSYENTTISIGGKSCIVVHTDAAWTVYNCE